MDDPATVDLMLAAQRAPVASHSMTSTRTTVRHPERKRVLRGAVLADRERALGPTHRATVHQSRFWGGPRVEPGCAATRSTTDVQNKATAATTRGIDGRAVPSCFVSLDPPDATRLDVRGRPYAVWDGS
jgi:hypothetical protein